MSELSYNPYDFLELQRTIENLDKDINEIIESVELRKQKELQNKLELYEKAFIEIYKALDLTMKSFFHNDKDRVEDKLEGFRMIIYKMTHHYNLLDEVREYHGI